MIKAVVHPEPTDPHAPRMNRVLDFIEANFAQDLKLETLAEVAAYSPYHFHRLFLAWTGETPNDMVRRRRLDAAGSKLRHSVHATVANVAAQVGFSSVEAFARAFKHQFGMTPTAWRHGGYLQWEALQRQREFEALQGPAPGPADEPPLSVSMQQAPELEIIYWRHTGNYDEAIIETWERFLPWSRALGLEGQACLGIGLDDPSITPEGSCRYDACVVLPPGWNRSQVRTSSRRVRGGYYACSPYDGSRADLGVTWMRILRQWLPGSGFVLSDSPFIEFYPPGVSPLTLPLQGVQLRVPVETQGR